MCRTNPSSDLSSSNQLRTYPQLGIKVHCGWFTLSHALSSSAPQQVSTSTTHLHMCAVNLTHCMRLVDCIAGQFRSGFQLQYVRLLSSLCLCEHCCQQGSHSLSTLHSHHHACCYRLATSLCSPQACSSVSDNWYLCLKRSR